MTCSEICSKSRWRSPSYFSCSLIQPVCCIQTILPDIHHSMASHGERIQFSTLSLLCQQRSLLETLFSSFIVQLITSNYAFKLIIVTQQREQFIPIFGISSPQELF